MDRSNQYTKPQTISVKQINELRKLKPKNPDINIPGIVIPAELDGKKRPIVAEENISTKIRFIFNSLTATNIEKTKVLLKEQINKLETAEDVQKVADEILANLIVSEQNIPNYMHLLNFASPHVVKVKPYIDKNTGKERDTTDSIGRCFIIKCRDLLFSMISETNIRDLAEIDQYDSDCIDEFNKRREKIFNLIITICHLYDQRKSTLIKLTGVQIIDLMNNIMNNYDKIQEKMKTLCNPKSDDECEDELEYEICRRMCNIYAEQLYVLLSRKAKDFSKDDSKFNGLTLKMQIARFREHIVPNIAEDYLLSNCNEIEY